MGYPYFRKHPYTFYHGIHPHFASPAWGNGSLIDVTGTAVEEEAPILKWLLLIFKMSGLCYVRLGGGFKSVLMFISIWAWYATCWLICFNWVVQPPPRKLVGWYHQRKIGFHDNDFCFRTPTSGCKSGWTLCWLEAKSCELYQCNLHGWSVYWFHQIWGLPTLKFFVPLQTNMLF